MRKCDDAGNFGKVMGDGRGADSGILQAGQRAIAEMRGTTGTGDPECGDVFGRGAVAFDVASETMASADPGDDWAGAAARAYSWANRRLAGRAASMAALDRAAHAVLARQADQVRYHRDRLDDVQDHLAELGRTSRTLATVPGLGEAMMAEFEMAAVSAALEVGSRQLRTLTARVDENTTELHGIAGEYSALTSPSSGPLDGEDPLDRDVPRGSEPADEDDLVGLDDGTPPAATSAGAPMTPPPATVGQSQPPGALPADAMSGLTSAFGFLGGMIGAVVSPLAAVLTGVAGAAEGSLSALTETGGDDRLANKRAADIRDTDNSLRADDADRARDGDDDEEDPEARRDGVEAHDEPPGAGTSGDAAAPVSFPPPEPSPAPAPIRPPQDRTGENP